jgi:vault protein inter-alpha-trypsin-like protein
MGSPSEAGQGSLLFKSEQGYLTAPTLKTDVSMRVTGIYVFPLPENAAVDHLDMQIGARVIEGRIKEREAAKCTYTAEKAEDGVTTHDPRTTSREQRASTMPPCSARDVRVPADRGEVILAAHPCAPHCAGESDH